MAKQLTVDQASGYYAQNVASMYPFEWSKDSVFWNSNAYIACKPGTFRITQTLADGTVPGIVLDFGGIQWQSIDRMFSLRGSWNVTISEYVLSGTNTALNVEYTPCVLCDGVSMFARIPAASITGALYAPRIMPYVHWFTAQQIIGGIPVTVWDSGNKPYAIPVTAGYDLFMVAKVVI